MNVYYFHPIRHFCKNQGLNHTVGIAGVCPSGKEHRKETNHINVWENICLFIEKETYSYHPTIKYLFIYRACE